MRNPKTDTPAEGVGHRGKPESPPAPSDCPDMSAAILESLPYPIRVLDGAAGAVVMANAAATADIFEKGADACRQMLCDRKGACDRHSPECALAHVLAGRGPRVTERAVARPDGSRAWVETRAFPIRAGAGAPDRVAVWTFDITARKEAEQSLAISREIYKTLLESLPARVWLKNRDLRYISCNSAFASGAGLHASEITGLDDFDIFPVETARRSRLDDLSAIASGTVLRREERAAAPGGDAGEQWFETLRAPVRNERGETIGVLGAAWDISARKRHEEEERRLSESLEQRVAARTRELTEALAALANRERELEETNRGLEEAIARANALALAAESANQAKNAFIANMNHEIRTPLNSILGFTEVLASMASDPVQKDYLDTITASGRLLLRLINDILDLSKIEAGKLLLEPKPTDMRLVLGETVRQFEPKARGKGLRLSAGWRTPNPPPLIILDEARIRQILLNLLGNAIKFTNAGEVAVEASISRREASDGRPLLLSLSVSDTGVGIPPGQLDGIFEPFAQRPGQDNAKYGGTGLGLSISKRLAEAMGGSIRMSSQPGAGSVFTVEIPCAPASCASSQDRPPDASAAPDSQRLDGLRILVVDDTPHDRLLVKGLLAGSGAAIIEAADGAEAMGILAAEPVDAVLMDLRMAGMDGRETAARIRGDQRTARIPILAVTAADAGAESGDRHGCASALFNAFIHKPLSRPLLVKEIARHAGRAIGDAPPEPAASTEQRTWRPARAEDAAAVAEFVRHALARRDRLSMDDFSRLAQEAADLAGRADHMPLAAWASHLAARSSSFDIAGIEAAMDNLPAIASPREEE